ncbi:hypothetical protein PNOK_0166300 [Pyrrhoderma noxium]|uniref:Uncharacterized protein n=1 Tax=Pyrrhoderma noxium TaxID=2282107 RepID=A0A286UQ31_9AGAM|nr:hypothetical protein PNOK_0166300 [Pyrrhoderma noxium]
MSSAAAREARRKAILSRGSDRLSKLTSSARGENHPAYTNIEPPTRNAPTMESFVGEESIMPTPPIRPDDGPTPPLQKSSNETGPTAWSVEEQQEFMRALMNAEPRIPPGLGDGEGGPGGELAAMMKMMGADSQMPPPMTQAQPPAAPSLYSKLRPLVHLLASWSLLSFFAFSLEPQAYASQPGSQVSSVWDRWAELGWRSAKEPFGVQPLPFFWAFVTLQLVLHSFQIFTRLDPVRPPTLLALALPYLPPTARSVITNVLVYVRMFGMLVDDLAILIFGIGLLIWASSWVSI